MPGVPTDRSIHLAGVRMVSAREGDTHTIVLSGELDIANAAPVESELLEAEAGDAACIVLDLRALSFLDSTGLRLLASAHCRAADAARRIEVVHAPGPVRRVLEVSGVLEILDRPTEAIAA